ncbi:hypothetical protein, partial [Streptomyces sp. NPDC005568]|uniref:GtrA family protein n=1 Tax=Streptomyces sp. NPDC005568 TaxID=3156887 RepID=UPI0033B5CC09
MNSLLSPKPETACAARVPEAVEARTDGVRKAPAAVAAPGPLASFVRFVVCGGGVGLLSSAAVPLLADGLGWLLANALVTVVSTLLCTELHARFTFGAGGRAGWRRHWQSAGSATAAYAVTSAAVLVLHLVTSAPGVQAEQAVYLGASGLAGAGRFLVLRLYVFAARPSRPAPAGPLPVRADATVPVPGELRARPRSAWASV